MTANVIEVTDADFEQTVLEESKRRPVVVDFWAGWCRPCLVLGPILEKVAEESSGAFLLAKMDVDANQSTAGQFRVMSIPNVWAFRDGRPVDQFVGALPEPAVRDWIATLLPSEGDRLATEAAQLEARDPEAALREYRQALERDPSSREARLGMGRMLVENGNFDEAREVVSPLLPDPEAERLLARIRVSGWGSEDGSNGLGRAKAAAAEGRWQDALEGLLTEVKDHPEAREAMLDVFAVLGDDDPLTREYRGKLAAALF